MLAEALVLAREEQRLASECAGLTWALDRQLPAAGTDETLRALRTEHGVAARRFDEFAAIAAVAHRDEWLTHVHAIIGALTALVGVASEQRAASWLLPTWQLAARGTAPPSFAAAYLEGVLLVDKNYRLLVKSAALPADFPRLPRLG